MLTPAHRQTAAPRTVANSFPTRIRRTRKARARSARPRRMRGSSRRSRRRPPRPGWAAASVPRVACTGCEAGSGAPPAISCVTALTLAAQRQRNPAPQRWHLARPRSLPSRPRRWPPPRDLLRSHLSRLSRIRLSRLNRSRRRSRLLCLRPSRRRSRARTPIHHRRWRYPSR